VKVGGSLRVAWCLCDISQNLPGINSYFSSSKTYHQLSRVPDTLVPELEACHKLRRFQVELESCCLQERGHVVVVALRVQVAPLEYDCTLSEK